MAIWLRNFIWISHWVPRQGKNTVCKLHNSIYGLRQASHQWFSTFTASLLEFGFTQSRNDYSLFANRRGASFVALLVYVDDIIIAGPNNEMLQQIKSFI